MARAAQEFNPAPAPQRPFAPAIVWPVRLALLLLASCSPSTPGRQPAHQEDTASAQDTAPWHDTGWHDTAPPDTAEPPTDPVVT